MEMARGVGGPRGGRTKVCGPTSGHCGGPAEYLRPDTWIRQGLGYSGDSAAKVLTKFCTPNSSPKKFWLCTIKFLSSQAFQPCMTLWVQNLPKLPKKIIFSQKSP